MQPINSNTDFWAMSSRELEEQLGRIASSEPEAVSAATRAEATRLVAQWEAARALPKGKPGESSRRMSQLDALQRRSIEILVRVARAA